MNASMHPQHARHGQLAQRSPHNASRMRGPPQAGNVHSHQIAQQAQQAQYAAAQRSAAQNMDPGRKVGQPTDKNMPDGIDELVIGDGVQQYRRLRELERRLDAIMMRKNLDTRDAMPQGIKQYRTMRISISNTVENQPWQGQTLDENTFDFNTGEEATYRVKIEGKLLDDEEDEDKASDVDSEDEDEHQEKPAEKDEDAMDESLDRSSKSGSHAKLSHFFKAITVDFDRGKAGITADTPTAIEWKKPSPPSANAAAADFDCLEFERKGDENVNCTVNFYRDETPERYLLSPELADLLDTEADDRTSIMMKLWDYVKAMGLQQDDEKRRFTCDDRLRAVFNAETLTFPELNNLIINHTTHLPPLPLPYTIRVDPNYHSTSPPQLTIYDIAVSLPPPRPVLTPSTIGILKTIRAHDESIAYTVQALQASKAKHAFMDSMSKDPAGFLKRWLGSQRRDMEVILGERWGVDEVGNQGREWRMGGKRGVWGTEGVRESVGLMVGKDARGRGVAG